MKPRNGVGRGVKEAETPRQRQAGPRGLQGRRLLYLWDLLVRVEVVVVEMILLPALPQTPLPNPKPLPEPEPKPAPKPNPEQLPNPPLPMLPALAAPPTTAAGERQRQGYSNQESYPKPG